MTSHFAYPYHAQIENGDILISELPVAVVIHCISGVRCALWRMHMILISPKIHISNSRLFWWYESSGCILCAWSLGYLCHAVWNVEL